MPGQGYDGTIKIDSRIDEKGFDKGIKGMVKGLAPLAAAVTALFVVLIGGRSVVAVAKLSAEFQRLQIAAQAVGQLQGVAADETRRVTDEIIASGIQTDVANRAYINFSREGLDTGLLPALARGAQDLNVFSAAGETSSDVLGRLEHGILTLNPLILRNAGAAVDVAQAVKDYGSEIGKTSDEMSLLEKRQGVLIAVTNKLKTVSGLYELSQKTVAGQLSSNTRIMNEFRAAIGSPFQDAFFKLIKGWNTLIKAMTASISEGGKMHDTFVTIGAAASILAEIIADLFGWLTQLFGLENTSKGVEELGEGVADAAGDMGDLAENTEDAGKAAKGALAPFDDLNVLAQDKDAAGAGGDGADAGLSALGVSGEIDASKFTNPMEEIITKAEEMKQALLDNELFVAISGLFGAIDDAFESAGKAIFETFKPAWDWFDDEVLSRGEDDKGAIDFIDSLSLSFENLSKWIDENQKLFVGLIIGLAILGLIMSGLGFSIFVIVGVLAALFFIITKAGKAWEIFTGLTALSIEIFKKLWGKLGDWFKTYVTDPINDNFGDTFAAIGEIVKGSLNYLINIINLFIDAVVFGLNTIIGAANIVGSISPGFSPIGKITSPQIPRLATGAVIPPNAEFLAVLGDQRSGTNIESPVETMRNVFAQELAKFQGGGGEQTINMEVFLDGEKIYENQKKVGARRGGSLIKSGAAI